MKKPPAAMRDKSDISERKAAAMIWIGTAVFLFGVMLLRR